MSKKKRDEEVRIIAECVEKLTAESLPPWKVEEEKPKSMEYPSLLITGLLLSAGRSLLSVILE